MKKSFGDKKRSNPGDFLKQSLGKIHIIIKEKLYKLN